VKLVMFIYKIDKSRSDVGEEYDVVDVHKVRTPVI
jgi:hypothetical protein